MAVLSFMDIGSDISASFISCLVSTKHVMLFYVYQAVV